jgi:hypothetical protein
MSGVWGVAPLGVLNAHAETTSLPFNPKKMILAILPIY